LGGVNFLNDMTLKDVATQQMTDIQKSVVLCPENNPQDRPKGDGTIIWWTKRSGPNARLI
jgi:hypothetical protein